MLILKYIRFIEVVKSNVLNVILVTMGRLS